ncbi:MAG TPA: hypothetical protein VHE55_19680 [Fimbriimonadaceae bacterium]|nr:hypothetical protein [Fimbriimonadaceae bacterium]
MKFAQRFFVVATAVAALSVQVLAAGVVGVWKGHIVVDSSKMDKTLTPQQQQMMKQSIAATKSMVITLTMKADKTYSASVSGTPGADNADTGTWKQAGNKITMTGSKPGPGGKPDVQTLVLSKDGKSMTMTLPGQMGVSAKVIFSH